jgi:predicted PurR-regulated permease PerM
VSDEPAAPAPEEPGTPPEPAAHDQEPTEHMEPAGNAAGSRTVPPKVVVPRWIQLATLPVALLGVWALARAAGVVLLIFVIAAVIALMLNPLVKLVNRGTRLPRGFAVAVVYVGFFLVLAGGVALLINPVTTQVKRLQRDVPGLVRSANRSLADLQRSLDRQGIKVKIQEQGKTALQTLQKQVLKRSSSIVSFGQDLLQRVVEAAFGVILVLVISIYMLLYADRIGELVRSVMPPGDGTEDDDFAIGAQRAVAGYVRAQLVFSLAMGLSAGLALWVFGAAGIFPDGQRYAVFFGVFYGLMELIPYVGPILGGIPPVLVALFGDPLSAVWVVLLLIALQQLEGHVIAPQVFGHTLRINPLIVIFALLLGAALYGILGALVSLPVAAVLREVVVYLRRHLVLEPWGSVEPALAGAMHDEPIVRRRCPECGAERDPDDAFCSRCGAEQAPRVGAPNL